MACTAGTAAAQTDSLEVDTTLTLGEITVKGMRVIKKVDRQLIIPTKEMVKASSNGFELLNLMTLDGIRVDPVMQTVSSMEAARCRCASTTSWPARRTSWRSGPTRWCA